MRLVLFCHSLISDWNHGNAHFLRGLVTDLVEAGHDVRVWEPRDAWSATSLAAELGALPIEEVAARYPALDIHRYVEADLDLDAATEGADAVVVHEWTSPRLVRELGRRRKRGARYALLFHDTHHRAVTDPTDFGRLDLDGYDAVLAFGETLRERYASRGWGPRAYTFHEAADVRVFRPLTAETRAGDLVWVGNYGDDERTRELEEFLFGPCQALGLCGTVYGVRYPDEGLRAIARAGLRYAGWIPNYRVPLAFAEHAVTIHVPRRPYAEALPGIPTIRVFEALACGIPLISAPWSDCENLFRPDDFVMVRTGAEMQRAIRWLRHDLSARDTFVQRGLETITSRHTTRHRARQLVQILRELSVHTRRPTGSEGASAWE